MQNRPGSWHSLTQQRDEILVATNFIIDGHKGSVFDDGLSDQDSIERVMVVKRQCAELQYVRSIDRQQCVNISLVTKNLLQRYIKGEAPPLVLYLKLPDTRGA